LEKCLLEKYLLKEYLTGKMYCWKKDWTEKRKGIRKLKNP